MTDPGRSPAPSLACSPRPSTEFDGYRLLDRIGEGGMGEVWRALDLTLDRQVAIKLIRDADPDERARERFRLEARALGRIQHPNVVAVYRSGEALGQLYIVYELVAGQSLDGLVGALSWQEVLALGVDLARGLAAAHHASVLHRDIKPANAMRTPAGAGKLIDFGVAKLRSGRAFGEAASDEAAPLVAVIDMRHGEMTRHGDLLGTPRYIAPELWRGAPASVTSDVYALGLALWELLAGAPAYADRPSFAALVEAIVCEPLTSIASLRPNIPFELAATIDRAVLKHPGERFASADALAGALEGVAATLRALGVLPDRSAATPSERQAELVRAMFRRALARSGFAVRFYERLFERYPEVRRMFPPDIRGQARKLVDALMASVACLREPERLYPMLEDLGARHVLYGVREVYLDNVGDVLREQLEDVEGGRMDDELAEAWSSAWEQLAGAVRRGLRRAALPEAGVGEDTSSMIDVRAVDLAEDGPQLGSTVLFRAEVVDKAALIAKVRASVIGDDAVFGGPFGMRRVVYADYTASGRSLDFIEAFLRAEVMPLHASTRLREDAREIIHAAVGGGSEDIVIFCGWGATGAADHVARALGLRLPPDLDDRYRLKERIPAEERPVVFIGPYEHPSNELVWRESIADVVTIDVDADGSIDLRQLEAELARYAARPLKIGSFSAASNVTGIIADDVAITALLHRHGALSFWDYAAAGPHLEIRMNPKGPGASGHLATKDAVFLSPHRFIGGPGTPGVLVAKRSIFEGKKPTVPGGAVVCTPAILESIRAGLVFQLKAAVGADTIRAREDDFVKRAIASFRKNERLWVLGSPELERMSFVSLLIRDGRDKFLHSNFVIALLDDLFGIQVSGGCSSAGPYGRRILGMDAERSIELGDALEAGCKAVQPGWFRVNFNYFITETVFEYILAAIHIIAASGWKLLPMYRCDAATGLWTHVAGRPRPALSLKDLTYGGGELEVRSMRTSEPESALAGYLEEARALFASDRRNRAGEKIFLR